jgi:hypothetical protein
MDETAAWPADTVGGGDGDCPAVAARSDEAAAGDM